MAVAKFDEEHGLIPAAPSYHRVFICNKEWYDEHKDEIPIGTLIHVTDDARETLEQVEAMINAIYNGEDGEIDIKLATINERLDAEEEKSDDFEDRISELETQGSNNKLNKPASASTTSNRVLVYSGSGVDTQYRDLSTVRAVWSGGTLYLYDN